MTQRTVKGFEVRLDRLYDLTHHMWVEPQAGGAVRIGMDSLGVEIAGTLAHITMSQPGVQIERGLPFGSLEAEKYVGPLVTPLSGVITAVNPAVTADPALLQHHPYDEGWLIEVTPTDLVGERAALVEGEEPLISRFSEKITEYKLEGVLAE